MLRIHCAIILAVLVAAYNGASFSCTIDNSVKTGTNSVVFTLSPGPLDVLKAAELGDSKSPAAIIDLLQSSVSNPAAAFGKSISDSVQKLTKAIPLPSPFILPPLPTCRFVWISGQLFCDNVPGQILPTLCKTFSAISNVTAPTSFHLPLPNVTPLDCANGPWGVANIRAPDVWATGIKGIGAVVANIDSGVRSTHVELRGNFRQQYGWFDAYEPTNTVPVDDHGHGTHTMGTICGKTMGVAPEATWIACKGCKAGSCDNEQLLSCAQWLLCPDGRAQGCTTRPNVINNSWGGGTGDTFFSSALTLMKQVGIINFFSSGNSGPSCETVVSPADSNNTKHGFLSVGATSCDESIGSYSSVGPSQAVDFLLQLTPQIVAPGSNIESAWNTDDTDVNTISGTSMSSPHVTGAAALLLSANSQWTFEVISRAFQNTAYRNDSSSNALTNCNALALKTEKWPNQVYGYGRIDVAAALESLTKGN